MLVWHARPETHRAAMEKFVADNALPPQGVEVVSHHHGIGIGFMLVESLDLDPVYRMCAAWAHLVTIEAHPVIGHEDARSALTS
jgi:hypothetical protein